MNKKVTGNVGEWSELYVLAHILAEGGIFAANKEEERKKDLFYKISKVIFDSGKNTQNLEYKIFENYIEVESNGKNVGLIDKLDIKKNIKPLFEDLTLSTKNKRSFYWKLGDNILKILVKDKIKASSSKKKDIDLVILDQITGQETPRTGFSIKSQLGSPATLINASKATNFTFELLDHNNYPPKKIPKLHKKNVKDNIKLLIESGIHFNLKHVDSEVFESNLSLIDSNLSKNLGKILISYYAGEANKLSELVKINFGKDTSEDRQSIYKIKHFLSTMALGMMPDTNWNGDLTTLGGLIIVKKDGDVLCYYLYNLAEFQDYLLENTKLETPSTSRYGIGSVYKLEGSLFIKLNLQVRFIK